MLTRTGAKLLDFGLARPGAPPVGGNGASAVPASRTVRQRARRHAAVHVARADAGADADARSDLFHSAALYEMLTGPRPSRPVRTRSPGGDSRARAGAAVGARAARPAGARAYRGDVPGQGSGRAVADGEGSLARAAVGQGGSGGSRAGAAGCPRGLAGRHRDGRDHGGRGARHWRGRRDAVEPDHAGPRQLRRPSARRHPVPARNDDMAVSPDGSRLVFGALSADGTLRGLVAAALRCH